MYSENKIERFKKKPIDIPVGPWNTYKDEWKGFGDWLGTGKIANKNRKFRPFKEARAFVQKLNLKGVKEYVQYCQNELKRFEVKPSDIPYHPRQTYTSEWKGWADWLGNGRTTRAYMKSFEQARAFVRKLNLKSSQEWKLYSANKLKGLKKPIDIPTSPHEVYETKWKDMGDWLGIEYRRQGSWRPFEEGRVYAQKLKLKSNKEWILYSQNKLKGFKKKPIDIPAQPHIAYKTKWKSWPDWLGRKSWKKFEDARAFVQKLKLKSNKEWTLYSTNKLKGFKKKPIDVPSSPRSVYNDEWKGWGDWLGNKK